MTGYRGCRCGAHGDIRGTGPWSALGGGGDFLLERLRRAGVVLHLRVRVLVDAVALQERVQVGVSASLHLLELDRGPGVHAHGSARGEERRKGFERRSAFGQSGHGRADELDENETRPGRVRRRGGSGNETRRSRGAMFGRAPDEADVDAESAVDPGTLEAHEDAVGHGCPLRVLGVAVGARLRRRRGRGLGAGEGGETRESARRTGNGGQRSARSTAARGARERRARSRRSSRWRRAARSEGWRARGRTPLSHCCCSSRSIAAASGDAIAPDLSTGACRRGVRSPTLARVAACAVRRCPPRRRASFDPAAREKAASDRSG